ncbi:MAG: AMP-binding protein [Alphaproteobacteria bacterium]
MSLSAVPARETCVARYLIDANAEAHGERPFLVFEDGRALSWRQARERIVRITAGLARLGVRQGEHVLSWLPTGEDCILLMLALNHMGAVYVPLNLAYRGRLLQHAVSLSDANLIVAHADLVPRLNEVDLAALDRIVVLGGEAQAPAGLERHGPEALSPDHAPPPELTRPIEPWDTQTVIFTSGTTGPSKAVLSSYCQGWSMMGPEAWPFITGADRYFMTMPMFHVGGTGLINCMLYRAASIAVVASFDTESFWPAIKRTQATVVFLLGAMASFLWKRPPGPEDRDHGLKLIFMVPLVDDVPAFAERFGVDVRTVFNMTEVNNPIVSDPQPRGRGFCGKVRPGTEARLVDGNDLEVPHGEVGEMILRTARPWALNHGYHNNPEATARAWRNGWFHTGDAFREDADGNYYYVDRVKDAIRRRGENISSYEVEIELLSHPAVREAAAVAVPAEHGEDEVMAVLSLLPDSELDPADLIEFLRSRLAHFMIPRYVRIMPDLPKTPTQKAEKHRLRDSGVTEDTWDREAAGIKVRRERIGEAST